MSQNKQKRNDLIDVTKLPGWPGYRTRSNRSGLDPLDTRTEAAHMEGTFLRTIFTGRARTRKPFYLVLMFIFGVIPFIVALILVIGDLPKVDSNFIVPILYLLLLLFITGALTFNFIMSIFEILRIIPPHKPPATQKTKVKKKNLPRRRKDFK